MNNPEGNTVLGDVAVLLTQEGHLSMLTAEQSTAGQLEICDTDLGHAVILSAFLLILPAMVLFWS